MICKKCGEENAEMKKCCSSCGAFLEGYTFNNVTAEFGYRGGDGNFYKSEEDYKATSMQHDWRTGEFVVRLSDGQLRGVTREKVTIDLSEFVTSELKVILIDGLGNQKDMTPVCIHSVDQIIFHSADGMEDEIIFLNQIE